MMETASEARRFTFPTPSWLVVFAAVIGYVLLLFGLDSVLPFQVLSPRFAPLTALGGVLAYWSLLWLMDLRDPRIWRDQLRFADYVRAWANAATQPMPDARSTETLRLQARRIGGITLAQQGGLVAGVGAGVSFLDHGGFVAILAFGAAMLIVGLALRRWLMGGE